MGALSVNLVRAGDQPVARCEVRKAVTIRRAGWTANETFTGNGIANWMDIFFKGIDLTMHIDSLILLRL